MRTVGEFTSSKNPSIDNILGHMIAENILESVKSDEISINDDLFKDFLCCVFASGNFEFLRVLAEKLYPDTRKDLIFDFINNVEKMTLEGEQSLRSKR